MSANPAHLVYCYADEDELYFKSLENHLASFTRSGYLVGWTDRQIDPGAYRKQALAEHFASANLIVLLLSPDFIGSDVCNECMHQALSLRHERHLHIIPILVRPVVLQHTLLEDLQFLPLNGEPISRWNNQDDAWQEIAIRIGHILSQFLGMPPLLPHKPPSLAIPQQPTHPLLFEPRNPYKGLQPFLARDERDFFGRERLMATLVKHVGAIHGAKQTDHARLLVLFGASGSGKSSVILAGLLPALQRGTLPGSDRWIYLEPMTPGSRPLEKLARTFWRSFSERGMVTSITALQNDLSAPSKR